MTVRGPDGAVVWQIDATGPEAVAKKRTLTFPNVDVNLDLGTQYTISLDGGVVQSADDDCSVKSKPEAWTFRTKLCKLFLPLICLDLSINLGTNGPFCSC